MSKKKKILLGILAAAVIAVAVWVVLRKTAPVPAYDPVSAADWCDDESERVTQAVCLSYLTYGCEACGDLSGTAADILDGGNLGIVTENFGLLRTDAADPTTAVFDTARVIREQIGSFRYLTSRKDEKSSFFGAAFCDETKKRVWVSYSGSVSFADALASAGLVFAPRLTAQEKAAFEFFEQVLATDEMKSGEYSLVLTGHSLGGALASMVSCRSGYPAVTVNGADALATDKIRSMTGTDAGGRINNYTTVPSGLSLMEFVQRLVLMGSGDGVNAVRFAPNGYTSDTHCAFSFLRFAGEDFTDPVLPEPAE